MGKMLNPPGRRKLMPLPRPRIIFLLALAAATSYLVLFSRHAPHVHMVPYLRDPPAPSPSPSRPDELSETKAEWHVEIDDLRYWRDPTDGENPDDVLPGYETDGKHREPGDVGRLQHEKNLRKMWRYLYMTTAGLKTSNLVYGNTLESLVLKDNRSDELRRPLRDDPRVDLIFAHDKPVRFDPYPDYNSDGWRRDGHAPYVPCKGPTGELVEDLLVFKGRPDKWPAAKFGSYDVLGMDANLCWERETRLGPFGLVQQKKRVGGEYKPVDWDNVDWGNLQQRCLKLNADRFDMQGSSRNEYLAAYPETAGLMQPPRAHVQAQLGHASPAGVAVAASPPPPPSAAQQLARRGTTIRQEAQRDRSPARPGGSVKAKETRTAVLLRSYTGRKYSDNDRQVIRSLVSELSLKTGGQYEVFLLVHSKDPNQRIFDDQEAYLSVLRDNVPAEFRGMTVLWNDEQVANIYTKLTDDEERSVHTAQWLSVQKFSHDHPQFDFIWNWEMDFRFTGHHYDLLDKLASFAKKQPRKYLWERNERWYIPEYHGDYDTAFREQVARRHGDDTVWGPVDLPFVNPVGPKPPVKSHDEDDYEWGVGEEADFITVGPIFDPIDSQWIIGKHVWGFSDARHRSVDLPRRTTIVTQSRISRRLLDAMHVENMRGNHVASEMTPQTIALLHGFKAVFAPHPVFMDRDWTGSFLNSWFNPGPRGECGGRGSPMGWGRERRYQGTTWYYRAEPPNRLYNNWMGWPDTGVGGQAWEEEHGRPCLPSVMLHQVKDTEPTSDDHRTGFDLAFG
ncbi:major facilitator superfamily transporter [Ophiocordyceps camponoti-floridani]|uniref:Major facilitator superfamily transporter n=1 Tax=Ophiocordyceps camponoti-floridani TaxID=2030778 RepID=A0A8H4Q3K7_9HYPO|nr:major facilitator superfamily transporter [Ophiocordyceps camponoti-floridani]